MSLDNEQITVKNFKAFYELIRPYLGGHDKGKLTFVGEIKAFFSETAPNGFLICDGATYNKADYPQLANLLLSLTDHSAYEVSGDSTKFKVPDLQGEFLRGTGTNSHTNQGSGANVGVHQDGTIINNVIGTNNTNGVAWYDNLYESNYNCDSTIGSDSSNTGTIATAKGNTGRTDINHTTRPTNTSVLFCIAYQDTMIDIDFFSCGGERFAKSDMYDTTEHVIGKWIDGKPIYQKTLEINSVPSSGGTLADITILNPDVVIDISGYFYRGNLNCYYSANRPSSNTNYITGVFFNKNSKTLTIDAGSDIVSQLTYAKITIQYTKTTDTTDSFKYANTTDYSTNEKIVGTWIDGKPLYQKTLDIGTLSGNDTFFSFSSIYNLTNIEHAWKVNGYLVNNGGWEYDDFYLSASDNANISVFNSGIRVVCSKYANITSGKITFQYTKTTD